MQTAIATPHTWTTYLDLALKAVSLLIVSVSAILAYRQIVKTHEWNRRKATHDLAFDHVQGPRTEVIKQLRIKFGAKFLDPGGPTFDALLRGLTTDEAKAEFLLSVRFLLNYAETVAIGIKNHVLDEDMCYDHSSLMVIAVWHWAQPEVKRLRAVDPTVWNEQEFYVTRWEKRATEEITRLRNPGKPRT